jgi:hypothetical protein
VNSWTSGRISPKRRISAFPLRARTHKSNSIGVGLANVRYAPGSNQILHRNEMTRCAKSGNGGYRSRKEKPPEGGFSM